MSADAILSPGETCWVLERADRLAWLVDGEAYFSAFAEVLDSARQQVLILGWDVHSGFDPGSRTGSGPSGPGDGDAGDRTLRSRLTSLARRRRDLHIHILTWDFAMIYALEREPLPSFQLGWRTHRRVRFELDDTHPVGASHHQKVVVVDDALAFVGGFDLTMRRWDRPEHGLEDERRRDPAGKAYGPFHDVQALVSGPAAARLGELARRRWQEATGETLPSPGAGTRGGGPETDAWPGGLDADHRDVSVGVARTLPELRRRAACREVEALHLEAIRSAQRVIYLENQYFTSHAIGEALAARLDEPDGPEVIFVGPRHQLGWLERSVMGQLRARLLQRLRQADRHGRFLAVYPELPGGDAEHVLNVHSKVMAVDDRFVTMGSANLSNRSMGFDSECNIALEQTEGQEPVTGLRDRLLAEHLDCSPDDVRRAVAGAGGSLRKAIQGLQGGERTLARLPAEDPEAWDVPDPALSAADPERPMAASDLLESLLGERLVNGGRSWMRWLAAAGAVAGLAALWLWGPLAGIEEPEALVAAWQSVRGERLFPAWIVVTYVIGTVLLVPLNLLVLATGAVLGPLAASATAMAGALAGAAVSFGAGRILGRRRVRRLLGRRARKVERRLSRHGTWMVAALRLLPVAPYGLVNAVAGASGLPWRPFMLGSLIGLTPGIVAVTLLGDRLRALITRPGPGTVVTLLVILALTLVGLWLARRRLRRLLGGEGEPS
jgi:phosphatidylserine/phosphatidylglycerophosphate/cardiolipin synthase-like enzyme/uncharacterized membrane protein YdjX (TVP38/TMEM64 family)